MKFLYLACPFYHEAANVRWARSEESAFVAAKLMVSEEAAVYSAVSSGYNLHMHLPGHLAHNHDFWLARDLVFLSHADALVLLPLSGWRESLGVQRELTFARKNDLEIWLLQDFKGKYDVLTKAELELLQPTRTLLVQS